MIFSAFLRIFYARYKKLCIEVVKMSLIPCDDDCIYQIDGYCKLEAPTIITNHLGGCVHYVKAEKDGYPEQSVREEPKGSIG